MSRHPFLHCAALVAATAGCTSLADVRVTYEECVPVKGALYVEEFNGTYQDLLDRCWRSDPAPAGTRTFTADGDLVVRPVRGARWTAASQAPIVYRSMPGDFLVATRVEAASTFQSDHCLNHDEAAGLVVRRPKPFAWATMLVRPYFDASIPFEEACKDETAHPPSARVQTDSAGLAELKTKSVDKVGADGEAYVAICRQGDQLAYYYKLAAPLPNEPAWIAIARQQIGLGPLDVGLTVSAAPLGNEDSGMEGHFAWAVIVDHSSAPAVDGCQGALSALVTPEGM